MEQNVQDSVPTEFRHAVPPKAFVVLRSVMIHLWSLVSILMVPNVSIHLIVVHLENMFAQWEKSLVMEHVIIPVLKFAMTVLFVRSAKVLVVRNASTLEQKTVIFLMEAFVMLLVAMIALKVLLSVQRAPKSLVEMDVKKLDLNSVITWMEPYVLLEIVYLQTDLALPLYSFVP